MLLIRYVLRSLLEFLPPSWWQKTTAFYFGLHRDRPRLKRGVLPDRYIREIFDVFVKKPLCIDQIVVGQKSAQDNCVVQLFHSWRCAHQISLLHNSPLRLLRENLLHPQRWAYCVNQDCPVALPKQKKHPCLHE